jgi:hypothetical protein
MRGWGEGILTGRNGAPRWLQQRQWQSEVTDGGGLLWNKEAELEDQRWRKNGSATQLVDQETVTIDCDGTWAPPGGATGQWKFQHGRRWRSSGTTDSVRLLPLVWGSMQIKEGSSVEASAWKKADCGVRALLPGTEAKNGAAVLELGPAVRCSKWGKGKVARGGGMRRRWRAAPGRLEGERSEECVTSKTKWLGS